MALSSANAFNEYLAGYKQVLPMAKTATRTTVAGIPFAIMDLAGWPSPTTLNPGNVTSGIVPVAGDTGYPPIAAYQGSNSGYLSKFDVWSSVNGSVILYDILFIAGQTTIPTSGTTTVALTNPPAFTTRIPFKSDGSTRDYSRVELFILMSVAGSNHAHSVSIDYLDQAGNAGNTGNMVTQSMAIGRMIRCPLAAGDTGVSGITGYKVNGATSSTGAVSVIAARKIMATRMGGFSMSNGIMETGLPIVFATSALQIVVNTESTLSGLINAHTEILEA